MVRRSRAAVVYTEHNVWERYHPATYWANMLTYPLSYHVFAVSEEVHRSIRFPRALSFLRMPPVETLYHGIPPGFAERWGRTNGVREELGIPPTSPIVGMVANLKAHKGHEYLVEATALLHGRRRDSGDGRNAPADAHRGGTPPRRLRPA